jgi:hypothetical protein
MIYEHQWTKGQGTSAQASVSSFVIRHSSFVCTPSDSKKKASKKPDPRSG